MLKKMINRCFLALIVFNITSHCIYAVQIDLKPVDTIESRLFGQNFTTDPVNKRLDRLEQSIFGRSYNEDINFRINRLKTLSSSYERKPEIVVESTSPAFQPSNIEKSATEYPALTQLEIKVLKQGFTKDNIYSRLNRMESSIFGTIFSNDSLADRIERLQNSVDNNEYSGNSIPVSSQNQSNGTVYSNISAIEGRLFGQTFENELITQRVSRIEQKIFGAVQTGMINQRLSRINSVVDNRFIPPDNPNSAQPNLQTSQSEIWNDNFFNDNNQNQSAFSDYKPGFFSMLQSLALSYILGRLNKNQYDPYQNYYNNPYYNYPNYAYNQPYQHSYPYAYGNPYQSYGMNSYNTSGFIPGLNSKTVINQSLQNNTGVGVRILPY